MHNANLIWLLLSIGCTDYELKNVDGDSVAGDNEEAALETTEQTDTGTSTETETEEDPQDETEEEEEDECIGESQIGFNIEEVSTLQDAVSYSVSGWTNDAIVLRFDDSGLRADQYWRVSAVEVLVLISDNHFPHFTDGQEISVQVFDSPTPMSGPNWTMAKSIVRAEQSWTDYMLPNDAWYAGTYGEFAQKGVWVRFETRELIPVSGMTSTDFLVGVMWEPPGMVKVGYSNFNQDCEKNWTDYGSGWGLNSENPDFFGCSWPMLRVEIEVITPDDCD